MIYILGILILIFTIMCFAFCFNWSRLIEIRDSIVVCSSNLDKILEEKLEMVNKLIKDIDNEKIKRDFVYNENDSLFDRENSLFNVSFAINKYVKESKNIKNSKVVPLNDLEEDIEGLKDYYNANVLNYNEIFLKKPFNRLFKLLKFDSFKAFKIRKLEEYEIFKN